MGTEVALSFNTLRTQLENERSSLFKIDENIKKIVQTSGRYSDRFNNQSGDYGRGGPRVGRNSYPDSGNNYNKNDELFGKRKNETKTVFSRLSARNGDSDNEDEVGVAKRARVSSAVSRELPTRAAVVRAQSGDEQARTRNRRIFGSLLGTLQKFKQEEIVLQTKEDKKAQVEKKIEEQARQMKEKEQKERKVLFAEREHKKATIKALEAKMHRVQEFEKWEVSQKSLGNFILTKAKPHIYWIPKKMSDKAEEKLSSSKKYHEKCMSRKREELQEELQRIEQRCLRPRPPAPRTPATKENLPHCAPDLTPAVALAVHRAGSAEGHDTSNGEERSSKRDKFAADADEKDKEESDVEDHQEVPDEAGHNDEEKESDESKMETTADPAEAELESQDDSQLATETNQNNESSQPEDPVENSPEHS